MRVIAGAYGGRRLEAPRGAATRPTADRVREALFSILGNLDGLTLLDLFAGSGALGIEGLSRGASRAVFVERAPRALAALRANLDALAIERDRAELRAVDARVAVRTARAAGETYDLLFLDPPYRQAAGLGRALSESLTALLAPGGRIVSESDRRAPLSLALPVVDERRYGDTLIRIYEHFPETAGG
jgi:16S rRNA (guanine(966)-N(2))-methyltransferase RsmD